MQPGVEVVGSAATATKALSLTATLSPDVVLLDSRLPDLDGAVAAAFMLETRNRRLEDIAP